jgi:hypothetical protein
MLIFPGCLALQKKAAVKRVYGLTSYPPLLLRGGNHNDRSEALPAIFASIFVAPSSGGRGPG